jgi:HD-GYP domain-containing protein (c-di-GMP phosphodiesterase class II)
MARISHQEALEKVNAGRLNFKDGYTEIPTSVFVDKIDVNMPALPAITFFQLKNNQFEVLRQGDQAYSPLALTLHETVWIKDGDFLVVKGYAENLLINPNLGSSLPVEKRMETLRKSAMLVVEDLFDKPSEENINRSIKVVSSFVYVIMKDPKAYLLLTKLSSHDPYTLQHSVGCAVNSIILARKKGIQSEQDLMDVGMGGLLHDLGKVKVKKEIINKNGPLDDLEWEEMRQHPQEGFAIVKDNPNISDLSKRAILEHHEDRNGTGYPFGIKGNDTHLFSKIVCIADVFNALTTNRTYAKARTPYDAFQFIRDKLAHKIDEDLFKQFVLVYGGKLDDLEE